jgi:4-hydroxy-tetrahydrodipicolinate reductase
MYKIGVYGSTGRVGTKLCEFLNQDNEAELSYAFSRGSANPDIKKLFELSDIVIDFSSKNGLDALLKEAVIFKKPLVIGTTGFSEEQKEAMNSAAREIAILYSPNMSRGITIITSFLQKYGTSLSEYDIDLVETHHRNKKDAPSGTALMLGKTITDNITNDEFKNYHSIRSGDGGFSEHEIIFSHGPERLKIHHQIMNSDIFARNAIIAAKWLIKTGYASGLYSITDVR